jgi:hypothetical protein
MNTPHPSPSGKAGSRPADLDFMSLFCEQHNCPLSEYEQRALRMCLYWQARIVGPLIRAIHPGYFDPDFELIRYLAKCRGRRNANNELVAFVENTNARGSFARKILHIRISARKTRALVNKVFERHAGPAVDYTDWTI